MVRSASRSVSTPTVISTSARAVQAGTVTGQPKAGDGQVEMIRTLRLARRSAMKARTQAANQLHALVVTAPDELRARLRPLPMAELITLVAAFRPVRTGTALGTPLAAAKLALKGLAIRYRQLSAEIDALDVHLEQPVGSAAPRL